MSALERIVAVLRCPVCREPISLDGGRLVCPAGHSFDVARQGYVNLVSGRAGPGTGDTAAMVAARAEFLERGHFAAVTDRLAEAVEGELVLDLAGGTGHHLAGVLDRHPDALGICLDLSAAALRRAARAHPRAAAVGADAWQRLPLAEHSVTTALSVFGPRDPAELERVLVPGGRVVVAAPTAEHLGELIAPLGMIGVDPHKDERQGAAFARFQTVGAHDVVRRVSLDHAEVLAVVAMGPTAAHVGAATLAERVAGLPDPVEVGIGVRITTYRTRPG